MDKLINNLRRVDKTELLFGMHNKTEILLLTSEDDVIARIPDAHAFFMTGGSDNIERGPDGWPIDTPWWTKQD